MGSLEHRSGAIPRCLVGTRHTYTPDTHAQSKLIEASIYMLADTVPCAWLVRIDLSIYVKPRGQSDQNGGRFCGFHRNKSRTETCYCCEPATKCAVPQCASTPFLSHASQPTAFYTREQKARNRSLDQSPQQPVRTRKVCASVVLCVNPASRRLRYGRVYVRAVQKAHYRILTPRQTRGDAFPPLKKG